VANLFFNDAFIKFRAKAMAQRDKIFAARAAAQAAIGQKLAADRAAQVAKLATAHQAKAAAASAPAISSPVSKLPADSPKPADKDCGCC